MVAWLARVLRSFGPAFTGIGTALRSQPNLQVHLVATLAVTTLGLIQNLPAWKWGCLGLCIGLVWVAELLNTALEKLCDRITLEQDEQIRQVKDIAAGAVLIASAVAVFMAFMIFL